VRTCSFCGVMLPEGASYCPSCGQPVAPTAIATPPEAGAAGQAAGAAAPGGQRPPASAAAAPAGETSSPRVAYTGDANDYGVYALIRRDQSPLGQETAQMLDATTITVHPRLSAYLGEVLGATFRVLILPVIALAIAYYFKARIPWQYTPLLLLVPAVIIVAKLIRVRTTTVTLEGGRLLISKGIFGKESHNIELYRVLDIALERTFMNRLTGDGTIVLTVEGIHGTRDPFRLLLTGLAGGHDLERLFARLRSLVLLLRTGPWGKGMIS
jgi:membrane protein YdbS with pleckstrin-like domain